MQQRSFDTKDSPTVQNLLEYARSHPYPKEVIQGTVTGIREYGRKANGRISFVTYTTQEHGDIDFYFHRETPSLFQAIEASETIFTVV